MNVRCLNFITFSFVILLFYSCGGKHEEKKYQVILSQAEKNRLNIVRFEKDIFSLNLDSISENIPRLKAKYGSFFELFNHKIVTLGSSESPKYSGELKRFLSDYYMNLNYQKVIQVFPNLTNLTDELSIAFARYKDEFPNKLVPRIYTCLSGWNQSIITSDSILVIALDKYLGSDCDFYLNLQLDKYKRYTMGRAYIPVDCMRAWGYATFEFKDSSENVLSNMLYEGKIFYFVKKMLPETSDTIIYGYRPDQLKWCNKNLKQMWTHLVEKKLLFSTDYMTIRKLIYPAPFTTLFTAESPGRAATWLGNKIVEAYMENNKVSLPELMKEKDYQKILRMSKFRP